MVDQDLDGIEQGMLAANGSDDFLAPVVRIEIDIVAVGDRIAQFWGAGNGGVLGEITLDGRDGGVLDVLRGGKMRLSRAEIDHVDSLRAQLIGFRHHCHRG
jgi:hypothetical protein